MSKHRVIAVIGATGAQGGGLIEAILKDPESGFVARAVTRNTDSPKAQALKSRGVEVVQANLDDVESLKAAFSGAYGVYGVTNYWEHFSPETELRQAKNIAEAARAENAKHVVWSTLEDTRKWVPLESDQMPTLMENYKVPHFDAKGESDAFFRDAGVPTTFMLTSFYWDNFIHFGMGPQASPDGSLMIAFPMDDKKLPGIAGKDIGACAFGIFKGGDKFIGKTVGIAGDHLSGSEMAAAMSQTLGRNIGFYPVSADAFRAMDFAGADDLGNMFQFKRDFNEDFRAARSIEFSRELNPELSSFADWLNEEGAKIPLP